jgi:class 3 adenylate cyclase
MKKLIRIALLFTVSSIFSQEWIPSIKAYLIPDERFEYHVGDLPHNNTNEINDLLSSDLWLSEDDIEGEELDQSEYYWKRYEIPSGLLTDPVIIVESYNTNVELYYQGNSLRSGDKTNKNRFTYQFYNSSNLQGGEHLLFRIKTNPYAGEEIYMADNSRDGIDQTRFYMYYLYEEYLIFIFSFFAALIGAIMMILFLFRINNREFYLFWFSLFALTYALFSLFESNLINVFIQINPVFDFFIPLVAQDLMPIFLVLFYIHYMGNSWLYFLNSLIIVQGVILIIRFLVMISGNFSEWADELALFYPILLYIGVSLHLGIRQRKNIFAPFFISAFLVLGLTYLLQLFSEYTEIFGDWPLFLGPRVFFIILGTLPFYSYLLNERHIKEQNRAFTRYIPKEFLQYLHRKEITDVLLGDQVQCEITILFSDIRSFTTISESMSPEENFSFLNTYLKEMGPIVRKNNGFIDKYIGDAVMALFPNDPSDAVITAVEMLDKLKEVNKGMEEKGFPEVRIGIGIHTGKAMLGILGEEERYQGTVISDAVNLASRLESMTKKTGYSILLSRETGCLLNKRFHLKYLGSTTVKGKNRTTKVYTLQNLVKSHPSLKTESSTLTKLALQEEKMPDQFENHTGGDCS